MRRLFSGLGYFFFAAFLISGLFSEDDEPRQDRAARPSLSLGEDKSTLLEDAPKRALLKTPEKAPLLQNTKTLLPDVTTDRATYAYVTASRLNLRNGPSAQNKKISSFVKGTKLSVVATSEGWARVNGSRNGSPVSGWVSSKFLSAKAPALPQVQKTRVIKRAVAVPSASNLAKARKAIIRQSIANHSGNCACDYQRDRAGRRCGKRSAWSRRGGYVPLCYENEVTQAHLATYFRRQKN